MSRLDRAIEAQRLFMYSVPDPDNRERAEANLMLLIFQRDELVQKHEMGLSKILVQ